MNWLKLVAAGVLAVALTIGGLFALGQNAFGASNIYIFPDLKGPSGQDHIKEPPPARLSDYERGSAHRLGILVTDPSSDWLGLVRAFKAAGVPFTVTQSAQIAFQHKVVLAYPIISGRALSPEALRGLAAHVHAGGTVLGFDLEGGGLDALFGVSRSIASRAREELHWSSSRGPSERGRTSPNSPNRIRRSGRAGVDPRDPWAGVRSLRR